jgi:hypothetical protein
VRDPHAPAGCLRRGALRRIENVAKWVSGTARERVQSQ